MKRSEINSIIKEMEDLLRRHSIYLPPFCSWTPDEWKTKNHEYDEIRDNMLGWDITDFGLGNFDRTGFALITLRNGNQHNPKYKKVYAEKLIMLRDGQTAPMHYHWKKSEDIINRGGGTLCITVRNGRADRTIDTSDVLVNSDGRSYYVKSGSGILLNPGESITLWPYQYHDFSISKGTGSVLIGEVSQCNDDTTDNCFYDKIGRFPKIENDEIPYRLLCNEYPAAADITK
jgi:D-lyxose ketol-isomerase